MRSKNESVLIRLISLADKCMADRYRVSAHRFRNRNERIERKIFQTGVTRGANRSTWTGVPGVYVFPYALTIIGFIFLPATQWDSRCNARINRRELDRGEVLSLSVAVWTSCRSKRSTKPIAPLPRRPAVFCTADDRRRPDSAASHLRRRSQVFRG